MELFVPEEQREQLERLDGLIETGMQILKEHAESVDPAQLDALIATAERFALRLDESLPPALEAVSVAEIRGILIGALRNLRATEDDEMDRPLDVLDDFLVRAESIRHIIRDTLDEELPVDPNDAQRLLQQLRDWLPRLTKKQLGELLGVEPRTLLRWEAGSGRASHRAEVVVRLVLLLRQAWTPEGVHAWFFRPRRDLDGHRPVDVLDDVAYERRLIQAVREGRAQHGS